MAPQRGKLDCFVASLLAMTTIAARCRAFHYNNASGILDHPLEPVIGLAGGETRWRVMTV
jgi:hypothetical protein